MKPRERKTREKSVGRSPPCSIGSSASSRKKQARFSRPAPRTSWPLSNNPPRMSARATHENTRAAAPTISRRRNTKKKERNAENGFVTKVVFVTPSPRFFPAHALHALLSSPSLLCFPSPLRFRLFFLFFPTTASPSSGPSCSAYSPPRSPHAPAAARRSTSAGAAPASPRDLPLRCCRSRRLRRRSRRRG